MEEKKVAKNEKNMTEESKSPPKKKVVKKKSIFKEKKFLLVLLALFLLIIVASGIFYWRKTTYDPARYESEVASADEAYAAMKYGEALDGYLLASDIAPSQPDAFHGMITVLTDKSRYEDAEKVLTEISSSVEGSEIAKMYVVLGDSYFDSGMYEEAFNAYHKGYKADSIEEASEGALASSMMLSDLNNASSYNEKRENSAKTDVDGFWADYLEVKDEDTELHIVVVTSKDLLNAGYAGLVKTLLEPRNEEMKEYWEGRYFLGRAYFDLGEFEKAEEEFNTAVSLGSDDYALYLYLARLNAMNGDKDKAYKFYDRATEFVDDEDAKNIVLEYADLLVDDQQYVRAEELLTQFAGEAWSQIAFMKLYATQGNYEGMLEASEKYLVQDEVDDALIIDYYTLLLDHYVDIEDGEQITLLLSELETLEGYESLNFFYKGKEADVSGDNVTAKEFYMISIDRDLMGEITERAEKEISNL